MNELLVEKRLNESNSVTHMPIKPIFDSDEENEDEESKKRKDEKGTQSDSKNIQKRTKYDAAAVIAAIDKISKEEARKMMKGKSVAK